MKKPILIFEKSNLDNKLQIARINERQLSFTITNNDDDKTHEVIVTINELMSVIKGLIV